MILRIWNKGALIVLLFKIVSSQASGNVCSKRFVGGKWVTHGDCKDHSNVIHAVKERAAPQNVYTSCRGVKLSLAKFRNNTGGVFNIEIAGVGTKEVYCNTEIDGGGWIVIQRRMDGSVDFNRSWSDYASGFGNPRGEYWLGLDAMHQLTKNGDAEMRLDMTADDGTYKFIKYSSFYVGPASNNYEMTAWGISGNATHALRVHSNQPFTTKDRDNDSHTTLNCARFRQGAWWHNQCGVTNLNGVYGKSNVKNGIFWDSTIRNHAILSFTEMKIRNKIRKAQ